MTPLGGAIPWAERPPRRRAGNRRRRGSPVAAPPGGAGEAARPGGTRRRRHDDDGRPPGGGPDEGAPAAPVLGLHRPPMTPWVRILSPASIVLEIRRSSCPSKAESSWSPAGAGVWGWG